MGLENFQIISKLGSGVYSSVYKARRFIDQKIYAIKKVKLASLTQKQKQNALNQAIILASFNHPHIIGYREAFVDQESSSLCIVMQYAANGDLLKMINEYRNSKLLFQQRFIWRVLISSLIGINKLHQNKILHRDIKSANIFITENQQIKIGDLNVSKVTQKGLCFTQTGTPYYASPQIWKDQPYGFKSDIWSLGCIIYELVNLKPPFQGQDMQQLYKSVTKGIYTKISNNYSADLSDIIRMMLQTDPSIRPSAQKMLNSSIIRKKVKQFRDLSEQINEIKVGQNCTQKIDQQLLRRKNIKKIQDFLPRQNYSRKRVKTLHQIRQPIKFVKQKKYSKKNSVLQDYSPSSYKFINMSLAKSRQNKQLSPQTKVNYELPLTNERSILQSYQKRIQNRNHPKIISKKNNIIELARRQISNNCRNPQQAERKRLYKQSQSSLNLYPHYESVNTSHLHKYVYQNQYNKYHNENLNFINSNQKSGQIKKINDEICEKIKRKNQKNIFGRYENSYMKRFMKSRVKLEYQNMMKVLNSTKNVSSIVLK